MRLIVSLLSGAIFGLGLIVSDMVNPARVLGFLDVAAMKTGTWDPTLAFVMGGALVPMAIAWRISAAASRPVCGGSFPGQPSGLIGGRLILGAGLFGAGWGLVGFCPGPALAALGAGSPGALIFGAAMIAGMAGFQLLNPAPKAA